MNNHVPTPMDMLVLTGSQIHELNGTKWKIASNDQDSQIIEEVNDRVGILFMPHK